MAIELPVYLDNHATTAVDPRVIEVMLPYFGTQFGNASSKSHVFGDQASNAVGTRGPCVPRVSGLLQRRSSSLFGATEAINLALKGTAEEKGFQGLHFVSVRTEHKATLDCLEYLEGRGVETTLLGVNGDGRISLSDLEEAIRPDTTLVSVIVANNEIGIIQPICEVGEICREHEALFVK